MVELRKHPSKVIYIRGKEAEIDSELAPLINELNRIGLKTKYCCIGGDDFDTLKRAYITFDSKNMWIEHSQLGITIRWVPYRNEEVLPDSDIPSYTPKFSPDEKPRWLDISEQVGF